MIVINYEGYQRLAQQLEAANFWDGMSLHLFQNSILPTPTTQIGDLVEADYDGYAAVPYATPSPIEFVDANGNLAVKFSSTDFQPTGSVVGNTIYGYWLDSDWGGTGDRALTIVVFETPVVMISPLNALTVEPVVPLGQPAN